jgi:hypothetical protein
VGGPPPPPPQQAPCVACWPSCSRWLRVSGEAIDVLGKDVVHDDSSNDSLFQFAR